MVAYGTILTLRPCNFRNKFILSINNNNIRCKVFIEQKKLKKKRKKDRKTRKKNIIVDTFDGKWCSMGDN